jgi:primosomal protein N'
VKAGFPYYFNVLVDVPLPGGEGLYTYGSSEKLQVGERIMVPFGKKDKIVEGYVISSAAPKGEIKAVYLRTGNRYFDEVRAAMINWIMENYISSPKPILNYLSPVTLKRALTKISLSPSYPNLEKQFLPRSRSLKKAIAFLEERNGEAYLEDFPGSRSLPLLLKSKVIDTVLEPLRKQHPVKKEPKSCLFWAPWREQYQLLLSLLRKAQEQKLQALVLVPESSLIEPLSSALAKDGVECLNFSGEQSPKVRRKIVFNCQHESSLILVGTWLSLFLPFWNLGLICVLQEENSAYRVLSPPYFPAVGLTRVLARNSGADLYLFSRAPSVESYLEAYRDRTLIKKEGKAILREVLYYRGERGLAPDIVYAIKRNSLEGKRTLVFLNRKGYANCLQCEDCGEDFSCPFCGVRLTPHQEELICHYCGHREEIPIVCPNCKGTNLKARGVGLEKVETQLKSILGELVILVNSEVAKSKKAVRAKIEAFKDNPSSVLLGTSILQGHAIPPVSLVVLVNLDFSLSLPFYSATERAYQLYKNLESLASEKIILQVSRQVNLDWLDEDFYLEELQSRKQTGFPPYKRIMRILFEAEEKSALWEAARKVKEYLDAYNSFVATEPIPCFHYKLRGRWRAEILVRFPVGAVPEELRNLYRIRLPRKVEMQLQLDPEELN